MPEPKEILASVSVSDIRTFLEANADKDEVKTFFGEIASKKELKPEEIQKFLDEKEDGKRLLQSLTDKRVTDALVTHKKNWEEKRLPEIKESLRSEIEEELLKKHGLKKSEDQKKIEELERKFQEQERTAKRNALQIAARDLAVKDGLPVELVDFLIGDDLDGTTANLKSVKKLIDAHIAAAVDKRFKENGGDPTKREVNDGPAKVSASDIERLAEKAKNHSTNENIAAYSKAKAAYAEQQKK